MHVGRHLIGEFRREGRDDGAHHGAEGIALRRPADALFVLGDLGGDVPVVHTGQRRRLHGLVPLALHAVAGGAGDIERLGGRRDAGSAGVKGVYGPGTPIPASAKDVLEQIKKANGL